MNFPSFRGTPKKVRDCRVKLLHLETEYRQFDTAVTEELRRLRASSKGTDPDLKRLTDDILTYPSSKRAVEKSILDTRWLGNGLKAKLLMDKLKNKKQRDKESAARKILEVLIREMR